MARGQDSQGARFRVGRARRTVGVMTSGDRQKRDGSAKRVQLTSGDHSGPKDTKAKRPRVGRPDRAQRKAAASRAWVELFDRLREVRQREQARVDPFQE
ncbi:hypothetical protein KBZ00_32305 [Streptomyces sp. RK31]|nr:hypothetical protein [Streptomyces sp. RK31]